jgi:hypothetical protein
MLKDTLQIGLYLFASFLSVVLIPIIDKILFIQQSEEPGIITFVGVGLAVSFFIIAALRVVMRTSLNIPGQFLFFFIIYNVFIIIVKFTLAPASLYLVNRIIDFKPDFNPNLFFQLEPLKPEVIGVEVIDNLDSGVNSNISEVDSETSSDISIYPYFKPGFYLSWFQSFWGIRLLVIFLLYLLVFWFMYFIFKQKFKNEVGLNPDQIMQNYNFTKYRKYKELTLIMIAIYIFMTSSSIVQILLEESPGLWWRIILEYFYYVLPIPPFLLLFVNYYNILIPGALVLAVYFATKAFQTAKEQALALRDISVLVSFFWIGAAFLFIYHALWAVYFLIITTLWPFRIVIPGK